MEHYQIGLMVETLPELAVDPHTPDTEGMNGVRILGAFNGCIVGLIRFSGQTGWERHPAGDELLHLIEGSTEIVQLAPEGMTTLIAKKGDVIKIPPNVWHSQRTLSPVKLMFITPAEGTEHCVDPIA